MVFEFCAGSLVGQSRMLGVLMELLEALSHTPFEHINSIRIHLKVRPQSRLKNFTIPAGRNFRGLHFGMLILLGHLSFQP
jgi:hypothetical protein